MLRDAHNRPSSHITKPSVLESMFVFFSKIILSCIKFLKLICFKKKKISPLISCTENAWRLMVTSKFFKTPIFSKDESTRKKVFFDRFSCGQFQKTTSPILKVNYQECRSQKCKQSYSPMNRTPRFIMYGPKLCKWE